MVGTSNGSGMTNRAFVEIDDPESIFSAQSSRKCTRGIIAMDSFTTQATNRTLEVLLAKTKATTRQSFP